MTARPAVMRPNEEAACDALAVAYGYSVVKFSRRAKAQIPDIPDRYYRHSRGVRLFWEVKQGRDKLSRGQYMFLVRELNCDGLAACGNRAMLKTLLDLLGRDMFLVTARVRCRELVDTLASAGFRGEKKPR